MRSRRLKGSLHDWCEFCLAPLGLKPQPHHLLLIDHLERLASGDIQRLMVTMPPGSAKTTYASILFACWFMAQHHGRTVIGVSHTAEMAEKISGDILRVAREFGPAVGVSLESEGVKSWRMSSRSEYKAAGVGANVTGRRADLAIIDDPVRSRASADSIIERDSTWSWYLADLSTRIKPDGRVMLIMTRWHEDDLAGRLLETDPQSWVVLKLPAQALAGDPLGRPVGTYLWSDDASYDYAGVLREQKLMLERSGAMRDWQSLYQQDPRPGEGALFKAGQIAVADEAPDDMQLVRAWDLAATAQVGTRDPDWTVGALLGKDSTGRFWICDICRLRGGPDAVESEICATAEWDGRHVKVSLPQDPGQAGKSQVLYLTRKLAGYRVESSRETGDKSTRAAPFAAQVNVGNVTMMRAGWNRALLDEISGFPAAAHDDQVDALSRAFAALIVPPPAPAQFTYIPFMGR